MGFAGYHGGVILPLGTDRFKRRPILIVYLLIAANMAVYAGMHILKQSDPALATGVENWGVLVPGQSAWWTYLSYAFLHANFSHILFNMVALWVFGPDVEDRLGRFGFLGLYCAGAIAAGGAHGLLTKVGVVGASGAIAAVIGSFLVFFPYVRIKTLVFFFFIGFFHITAWWYVAFAIAGDLLGLARTGQSNVAHLAHLGGYGLGIGVSLLLLAFHIVPREPYDMFSLGRQKVRRRAFKVAYRQGDQTAAHRTANEPAIKQPEGPASEARLKAQERFTNGDTPGAAASYLEMRRTAKSNKLPPLGRRPLYEIANHLFEQGDHANAADAYRQFLSAYEKDAEAPRVMLMLGLLNARFLNDPTEAKRLLEACKDRVASADEKALAIELLEEIG